MRRLDIPIFLFFFLSLQGFSQEEIPLSADDICPIKIGTELPPIQLENIDGTSFDLNQSVRQKPTVLVFYRGGWCPYCNRQLSGLRVAIDSLRAMGFQLLAVSPDRGEWLKQTIEEQELPYTLLSDHTMEASRKLGIAFRLDDRTFNRYEDRGYNLEGRSAATHHLLPVPAVFLLDTDGIIQFSYVNPNYRVRIRPTILLSAAEALIRNQS